MGRTAGQLPPTRPPETISRVLRRFQDDGLVQVDRRELEIRDAGRLQVLAKAVLQD